MPINPAIGSAAVSGGSSLLGSALGWLNQRSANKTNLKIARETNQMNYQIAQEANANAYKIFQEQLGYNSPVNQRKMLEEAGYNPADLFGGNNAGVSAPAAPDQKTAQMQRAEVSPYLGFSQDLAVMGQNLAAIASAKKDYEESKKTELENSVFMEQMKLQFEQLGLSNEWQKIQNKIHGDTIPEQINRIINESDLTLEQKNEIHMRNALLETFGEKEYRAKINQLEEQAKLWQQQGKTEITQQDLNRALGRKADSEANLAAVQAWYHKFIAESEKQRNFAVGRAAAWQGELSHQQYVLNTQFAKDERTMGLYKTLQEANFSEAAVEKCFLEAKKINKDLQWYEYQQLVDGFKILSNLGLGALFMVK